MVIFDDLKRFARDIEFHIKLRRAFKSRGAQIECLNFRFDDTPEGRFIENVLAAQGELERDQNSRQTLQKMQARMRSGYWSLSCPIGYRYESQRGQGKVLVRNEPLASYITEAFEGFASGRFQTQAEVKRYFESCPEFPKSKRGSVTSQRVADIFSRPIYAGYIVHEGWEIDWVKGHHEPLISLDTYNRIQGRRSQARVAPVRSNVNEDFPLRGFVVCDDCGEPYTACWSKGNLKRYPYYLCFNKDCESYRKSIPRAKLEDEFASLLHHLQPTEKLLTLAKAMFHQAWEVRKKQADERRNTLEEKVRRLDKQVGDLLDRVVNADSPTVIAAYERKIKTLEKERLIMEEKLSNQATQKDTQGVLFEHAMGFLANPWNLWETGQYYLQRMVLRLAFTDRISYSRKSGLRTPKTTLPFNMLGGFGALENKMAHLEGFEPPTAWFVARYSIQLS